MIYKLIQQGVIAIVIVGACAFAWASVAPTPLFGSGSSARYEASRHDRGDRYGDKHDIKHGRDHGGWVPAHAERQARSFPAFQDRD